MRQMFTLPNRPQTFSPHIFMIFTAAYAIVDVVLRHYKIGRIIY